MTIRNETDPLTVQRVLLEKLYAVKPARRRHMQWVMPRLELERLKAMLPAKDLQEVAPGKWYLFAQLVRVDNDASDVRLELEPPPRAFIDGHEFDLRDLSINIEQIDVTTAMEPDPTWTHVDQQGHFHAYDDEFKLPTLVTRAEQIECDGACEDPGCEGYSITHHHCRICDEEIKPGIRASTGRSYTPGLMSWRVVVRGGAGQIPDMSNSNVSVRAIKGDHEYFGVGVLTEVSGTVGEFAEATIEGNGPLGKRRAA